MSRSMNTVQRSLEMGAGAFIARPAYSERLTPSLTACSSMKLPVPAAQTLFMTEEVTIPFFKVVNFASCPPISMIVSVSLLSSNAARA